jgi:hypothetical protein
MRYVQLFHWMLNSDAWKDSSAAARSIYLEIAKRYNGTNNGFIVPEQRGAFHWKVDNTGFRRRPATEWRLTCYDSDRATGYAEKLATKEFMRWQKSI